MTNQILADLSAECRAALLPRLLTKPIHAGEILYVTGSPLHSIIMPHAGLISLQAQMRDGRMIEKAHAGWDGAAGCEVLFGSARAETHAVVLIAGEASWLTLQDLDDLRRRHASLDQAMLRWVARLLARTTQAVVCASVHPASQRIASWLLRADDITRGQRFDLMQRSLAEVLGLRLATVSEVCNRLMQQGAIRYSRGALEILDRDLLLAKACECYAANLAGAAAVAPASRSAEPEFTDAG